MAEAVQRPIVRSEPVIPRETAEFDSDGLADARQWAKPTHCGPSRTAGIAQPVSPGESLGMARSN
jgi:hypothetical protein